MWNCFVTEQNHPLQPGVIAKAYKASVRLKAESISPAARHCEPEGLVLWLSG